MNLERNILMMDMLWFPPPLRSSAAPPVSSLVLSTDMETEYSSITFWNEFHKDCCNCNVVKFLYPVAFFYKVVITIGNVCFEIP